jgi:hypothetical protein
MRSLVASDTPPMMPEKASSIRAAVDGLTAGPVSNSISAGSGAAGWPVGAPDGSAPAGGPDMLASRCE